MEDGPLLGWRQTWFGIEPSDTSFRGIVRRLSKSEVRFDELFYASPDPVICPYENDLGPSALQTQA